MKLYTRGKQVGFVALIVLASVASAQDSVKIETKWTKDTKVTIKFKSTIDIADHHATVEGKTSTTGSTNADGYALNIAIKSLSIVADDNEINPTFEDYKVALNQAGVIGSLEGGIDGTDAVRMFLSTNFFVPSQSAKKDVAATWEIAKNDKIGISKLSITSTYLGDAKVGDIVTHKFKQTVSEDGTQYKTEGMYFVTDTGQVLKADVSFSGLPIPAAGGDASGKTTLTPDE